MPNPFDKLASRMDAATVNKMGKPAIINGEPMIVIPAEFLEEMGPMTGTGRSLVVFTAGYRPKRSDVVIFEGEEFILTRHERFNGKPRIFIE
ncbi:TPA: ATP-binding protein [Kluyvera cryocrescens]|uniref:ATP-binding protein n=1 Tax=Kluyvera TaxID=579 RepID=UPI001A339A24|nr:MULTISPECIES: ATP-binding protein [Kluyvera]MBW9460475.1 ATP-binding protein [Kluyvera sp. EC_51]MEB6387796.1 ATP-binding protein [Kluyvera ascorbata]MEB7711817.1 ATP-binding protein [Kluyvera cryocrescens]HAT1569275.1 ATP-binding protein [Kluyvera cryocrescens]